MRLTDTQIRETVAAMRMSDHERSVLLRRALAGDPAARFVVHTHWLRLQRAEEAG